MGKIIRKMGKKGKEKIIRKTNNTDDTKKVKILFVSHEFDIGGSTVSLISLLHGLQSYNEIESKVLLPYKKKGKAALIFKRNKISYKEMWYRKNYKPISEKYSLKYYVFDLMNKLAVKRIQKYIQKEKFDIICSNSTGVDVGARASNFTKVPHIYYVREFMKDDHRCEYRNQSRMKYLLESSEYVIFISKTIASYYKANYRFQNAVQFFDGFIMRDYYIEKHNILKEETISFVQVGAFADGKGTINTIELLHQMNESGINNWNMEFIGSGGKEYIQKMQTLILKYHMNSQIIISEFCFDIKAKLSQKDILIMNSKSEGFGRVTIEGMLAGCLVIGKYLCGTSEIIIDQLNGIAFEREDEFIDAIHQIISQKEKYRYLAKSGQAYAMQKFDCANTAKNFVQVIEGCLK